MKINSETWKNFGFSGIGLVLIFRFGMGFNPGFRGRVPITTRFTHQNNFSRQIFQYGKNNYSILMLLTMWEKSIDFARIFLHAPLGRKIVIKKYLFSLMKILVWSFFKISFPIFSALFVDIVFGIEFYVVDSNLFCKWQLEQSFNFRWEDFFFLKNPQRMF